MMTSTPSDIQDPPDTQVLEAYTDALRALVTALGWQIDPVRLHADLQKIAGVTRRSGHGASAGLIDELAHTVETRLLTTNVSIERTIILNPVVDRSFSRSEP